VSTKKQCGAKPTIGRRAQDRIGRELRAVYEPFVQEPLPDEFLILLRAWKDAETARYRVTHAVEILRGANRGLDLNLSARSASSLTVHAQQMLVARAVRAHFGRPSMRRAPRHGPDRACEPVSDTFATVAAFPARKRLSGAGDGRAEIRKSHAKAAPETRKRKKATR
jgi:hypothetical protein